jgi:hypothetical protein
MAATAAQAQRGGPIIGSNMNAPGVLGPAARFKAADSDGDGKVTKPEFAATLNLDARRYVNFIWLNRDKNNDGWLTQDEMTTNGVTLRPGPSGTTGPSGGDGPSPPIPAR